MAYTYYICHANGRVHVNVIASSIKFINKHNVLQCIDSSQPWWFHEIVNILCLNTVKVWVIL